MPELKLVPAKGRTVPLEDGRDWPVDETGKPIAVLTETSGYYRRRLTDEDLLVAEDDAPAVPAGDPPVGGQADETKKTGGGSRKTES